MTTTAILFDEKSRMPKEIEIPTDEDGAFNVEYLHALMKCEIFDIISVGINGTKLDVFVDDEFLLKNDKFDTPTMMCSNYPEMIFGNVIISRYDGNGGHINTTKADFAKVRASLYYVQRDKDYVYDSGIGDKSIHFKADERFINYEK